jgi:trehalose/maltose hydrolase-like predicted phosphorylase
MTWTVSDEKFNNKNIVNNGNKFITGNGYMGFRGTSKGIVGGNQLTHLMVYLLLYLLMGKSLDCFKRNQ